MMWADVNDVFVLTVHSRAFLHTTHKTHHNTHKCTRAHKHTHAQRRIDINIVSVISPCHGEKLSLTWSIYFLSSVNVRQCYLPWITDWSQRLCYWSLEMLPTALGGVLFLFPLPDFISVAAGVCLEASGAAGVVTLLGAWKVFLLRSVG